MIIPFDDAKPYIICLLFDAEIVSVRMTNSLDDAIQTAVDLVLQHYSFDKNELIDELKEFHRVLDLSGGTIVQICQPGQDFYKNMNGN